MGTLYLSLCQCCYPVMEVTCVVIKNVLETGNGIITVFVHVCASTCAYVYVCIFVRVPCNECIKGKICLSTKHYIQFQKTQKYKKTAHNLLTHMLHMTTLPTKASLDDVPTHSTQGDTQYTGGHPVHRGTHSTQGDTQYTGGHPEHRGTPSKQGDTQGPIQ